MNRNGGNEMREYVEANLVVDFFEGTVAEIITDSDEDYDIAPCGMPPCRGEDDGPILFWD